MAGQSNGGVTVFLRVVVRNRAAVAALMSVVDELREMAEDLPWTSAGEMADRLEASLEELDVVSTR